MAPTATARTSFTSHPNNGASNPSSGSASAPVMLQDLEQTLSLLSSHRSVLGYILLSRGQPVSIIRHSGVIFEGEQGKKYASAIGKIVESVQTGLEEVHGGDHDGVSAESRLVIRDLNWHYICNVIRTTFDL